MFGLIEAVAAHRPKSRFIQCRTSAAVLVSATAIYLGCTTPAHGKQLANVGQFPGKISFGPLQLSTEDDFQNMEQVHQLVQGIYYSQFAPGTAPASFAEAWSEVTAALRQLAEVARAVPALRLAVGMELYHWFYFKWHQGTVPLARVDVDSLELSAELLWGSLLSSGCVLEEVEPLHGTRGGNDVSKDNTCHHIDGSSSSNNDSSRCQSVDNSSNSNNSSNGNSNSSNKSHLGSVLHHFMQQGCHYRWPQVVMIEAELGIELSTGFDVRLAAKVLRETSRHFAAMMQHPYCSGRPWMTPHDMNFNEEHFPSPGPVWPREAFPLVPWLEANFETFHRELEELRAQPGVFERLRQLERNAEAQDHARETDWTIVELADTRGGTLEAKQLQTFASDL
ncbi:unnamed protein product [Polarella glacialis]|uniref:Uncharacterized protein n=1 Tax=Polarella glacialis TaxID=89957 RepID=A0A813H7E9_POLGL|nr:unnamed protein product [Polarella glacialis]